MGRAAWDYRAHASAFGAAAPVFIMPRCHMVTWHYEDRFIGHNGHRSLIAGWVVKPCVQRLSGDECPCRSIEGALQPALTDLRATARHRKAASRKACWISTVLEAAGHEAQFRAEMVRPL